MSEDTQISAYISLIARERLERYVTRTGRKKGRVIEEALLHHLQALEELPPSAIIPPVLVVSDEGLEQIVDLIENPREPTQALKDLMSRYGD